MENFAQAFPVICRLSSSCTADLASIDSECNRPPWSDRMFAQEFANPASIVFGAREDGDIVGFLVAHHAVDEAHIVNFGVREAKRGLGIGKELLSHALFDLYERAVRWVTLEVRQGNAAALALYASMGFSEVGVRERYYSDNGEDALVLSLNLLQFVGSKVACHG